MQNPIQKFIHSSIGFIVCTSPFLLGNEDGGWTSYQIFKTGGGLRGSQFLQGVAGKERGDTFQWGCSFYIKNKLKFEILTDKKRL